MPPCCAGVDAGVPGRALPGSTPRASTSAAHIASCSSPVSSRVPRAALRQHQAAARGVGGVWSWLLCRCGSGPVSRSGGILRHGGCAQRSNGRDLWVIVGVGVPGHAFLFSASQVFASCRLNVGPDLDQDPVQDGIWVVFAAASRPTWPYPGEARGVSGRGDFRLLSASLAVTPRGPARDDSMTAWPRRVLAARGPNEADAHLVVLSSRH